MKRVLCGKLGQPSSLAEGWAADTKDMMINNVETLKDIANAGGEGLDDLLGLLPEPQVPPRARFTIKASLRAVLQEAIDGSTDVSTPPPKRPKLAVPSPLTMVLETGEAIGLYFHAFPSTELVGDKSGFKAFSNVMHLNILRMRPDLHGKQALQNETTLRWKEKKAPRDAMKVLVKERSGLAAEVKVFLEGPPKRKAGWEAPVNDGGDGTATAKGLQDRLNALDAQITVAHQRNSEKLAKLETPVKFKPVEAILKKTVAPAHVQNFKVKPEDYLLKVGSPSSKYMATDQLYIALLTKANSEWQEVMAKLEPLLQIKIESFLDSEVEEALIADGFDYDSDDGIDIAANPKNPADGLPEVDAPELTESFVLETVQEMLAAPGTSDEQVTIDALLDELNENLAINFFGGATRPRLYVKAQLEPVLVALEEDDNNIMYRDGVIHGI